MALVYLKVKNHHPDWMFEIVTDVAIVIILLGVGEIIFGFLLAWLSFYVSKTFRYIKIKNKKI